MNDKEKHNIIHCLIVYGNCTQRYALPCCSSVHFYSSVQAVVTQNKYLVEIKKADFTHISSSYAKSIDQHPTSQIASVAGRCEGIGRDSFRKGEGGSM